MHNVYIHIIHKYIYLYIRAYVHMNIYMYIYMYMTSRTEFIHEGTRVPITTTVIFVLGLSPSIVTCSTTFDRSRTLVLPPSLP